MESGNPMERVGIDILGPLPTTDRGNRFVLLAVDYFTRWPEAWALPDHTAATIARTLVTEYFSRFGVCQVLHSDCGRDFQSSLMREIGEMLDIDRTRMSSYHPQCDGLVERMNPTLIMLIRLNVVDARENWDLRVNLVVLAYRTSIQSSSGFTPAKLMFGRELRLPIDIMYGSPPEPPRYANDSVTHLQKVMQNIFEQARQNTSASHKRQKDYYDRKAEKRQYNPGELIWLHAAFKPAGGKFNRTWTGQFKVVKRYSDVTYKIADTVTGKEKITHIDRTKPVRVNTDQLNPVEESTKFVKDESSEDEEEAPRTRPVDLHNRDKGAVK